MATLTIRNLDEELKARLRVESARRGHSMEEEARAILKRALAGKGQQRGLGTRIHTRVAALGGLELEAPKRKTKPRAARLPK
jgi:plasmid stability protein